MQRIKRLLLFYLITARWNLLVNKLHGEFNTSKARDGLAF